MIKNYINNMKQRIRLTESQLNRVIKESVRSILNEIGDTPRGQYFLGRLSSRNNEHDEYEYYYDDNGNEIPAPVRDYAINARYESNFKKPMLSSEDVPFSIGRNDELGRRYANPELMRKYRSLNNLPQVNESRDYDFYNPYLSGYASCFKGKFDINGYHIEIDDMYNVLINNGEEEYFLQGDEADDFIYDMCLEWNNNPNMSRDEILYAFVQQY